MAAAGAVCGAAGGTTRPGAARWPAPLPPAAPPRRWLLPPPCDTAANASARDCTNFQNPGLRHAPFSLERFSPGIQLHYSMPSRQTCQRAVHYGSRCRQLTLYVLHCGYMTSCGRQAARCVIGTCVASAARVQPHAGVALERKALCARSFGSSVFVFSQIAPPLNKK